MNKEDRISRLEEQVQELRVKYKTASPAMKNLLETEARQKNGEIRILKEVIKKQKLKTEQNAKLL